MRQPSVRLGALLGGLSGLALMALFFLGERVAGLPFVPFDLFDWLARVLPGDVITVGVDAIVRAIQTFNLGPTSTAAKTLEQGMGLALVLGVCVGLGALVALLLRRTERPGWQVGALVGLLAFAGVALVELDLGLLTDPALGLLWLLGLFVGWGALLGGWLGNAPLATAPATEGARVSRRAALARIGGGSLAVALGSWGLARFIQAPAARVSGAGQSLADLGIAAAPPTPGPMVQPATATTLPASATPLPTATRTPEPTATRTPSATPTPDSSPTPGATATAEPTATATPEPPTATPEPPTATPEPPPPTAQPVGPVRDRVPAAPGTRAEVTSNADFYRIDINTRPVALDGATWAMEVSGKFDNPRPLTLQDFYNYPAVTQTLTMGCISNRVGGDLIGTSHWTGVRAWQVLSDLGIHNDVAALYIESADGFFESVRREDLMDPRCLFVYGMNGETLPVEHGFPLRIYLPNRYGMKQPKWITRIEARGEWEPGYWVVRGWSQEARPQIVSVIDTLAVNAIANGQVPIGGIAWAGDRGITRVEIQVDGGPWQETILRTPALSPLTWVQWRYDWPLVAGQHTFRVRATDGTGTLQTEREQPVRPDGATGYHTMSGSF